MSTKTDTITTETTTQTALTGYLMDYNTAEAIRPATDAELHASIDAAVRDGGAGVITVDGRRCYVQD